MANTFIAAAGRQAQMSGGMLTALGTAAIAKLYSGPQPASADVAITTQTVLATFTLPNPAGTAATGVLTMGAIAAATAAATGVAAFLRQLETDGTTVLWDTNAGPPNSTPVTLNAPVNVSDTSMTVLALPIPVVQGQVLWFLDAVSGVLKSVTVGGTAGQQFAVGATTVTITSASIAIATASVTKSGSGISNAQIQQSASPSISSYTLTAPSQGV